MSSKAKINNMSIALFWLAALLFAASPSNTYGFEVFSVFNKNFLSKRHITTPARADNTSSTKIDPDNLDQEMLAELIRQKVNAFRKTKKLAPLANDPILSKAAIDQCDYVTQKGSLSHEQTPGPKHTVLDRIKYYEGAYYLVGENLIYHGFKHRVTDTGNRQFETIIYPTYDEAADQIVKGWIKSKPHLANLVEPNYKYVGTHVEYSAKKGGLFSAQVFAGIKKPQ